jgi:hypothetical protein
LNQIKKALACFASTRRERGRGERARLPGWLDEFVKKHSPKM